MKKKLLSGLGLSLFLMVFSAQAQKTLPTNVYPSNLDENMYFEKYDASTFTVKNLKFLVLSDGDNSKDVTPAFDVSIYLIPQGSTSAEDVIIIKTYNLDGIYHMGSHEFDNQNISFAGKDIKPGTYRLGIWVNSSKSFEENGSDNAILFQDPIQIRTNPANLAAPLKKDNSNKPKDEEEDDHSSDDWGW
jgi:hypothetical protein